ncbi:MAG: Coq4 family protein [Pseudomonadaceae bacterium]|nr:Coq4 family protein [Pseudomonadaceae bacterium]
MSASLVNTLIPHCKRPSLEALQRVANAAREGDAEGRLHVCGAMLWAAFASPAATTSVFDALSHAWLLRGQSEPGSWDSQECPLPQGFWQAFEDVLDGSDAGYDATSITTTVAALNAHVHSDFTELAERAAAAHPGADGAVHKTAPGLLSLAELARQPKGSLARELHSMWVDNNFDPEVLDRDAIGLAQLPLALRYLNTRILQMHDVWHLIAGYQTTALHEIAISAFQLAQFGHNYSGQFLATVACISHRNAPEGFGLLLQTISEAWQHGRNVTPLMAVDWESCWHKDIDSLRNELAVPVFEGSFPADLFEQLRGDAA